MATATDPICLMQVDTDNPNGGTSEYEGQTYYFCAPGCRIAFERDPEGWAWPQQAHRHCWPQPQPVTFVRRMLRRGQ